MNILSPMTLLHENGYKALAATNNSDDLRLEMTELQRKVVRVGEGDLNVTVGFSNLNNEIGDLGRNFNRMVQQLRENREDVERLQSCPAVACGMLGHSRRTCYRASSRSGQHLSPVLHDEAKRHWTGTLNGPPYC
jgi:HAMP domain-containing protein